MAEADDRQAETLECGILLGVDLAATGFVMMRAVDEDSRPLGGVQEVDPRSGLLDQHLALVRQAETTGSEPVEELLFQRRLNQGIQGLQGSRCSRKLGCLEPFENRNAA